MWTAEPADPASGRDRRGGEGAAENGGARAVMMKSHGGSGGAATYLLAERGTSGKKRDKVEVLRGDPFER